MSNIGKRVRVVPSKEGVYDDSTIANLEVNTGVIENENNIIYIEKALLNVK